MAIITPIPGGQKIKDTYEIIYENDQAVNKQLEDHIAGTADKHQASAIETSSGNNVQEHIDGVSDKHNSSDIVNDSDVAGASQSDANNTLKSLIDALVLGPSNATIGAYPISVTGTNTYIGSFTDLTYFTGLMINLTGITENTAASTVDINGLGAKDVKIRLQDGSLRDVEAGELHDEIQVIYDGTQFVVLDNGAKGSEKAIRDSFSADADRYVGNTKLAEDGQDEGSWSISASSTISADIVNKKIGNQSVKMTSTVASGTVAIKKDNITLDLSKLKNGLDSNDDDYINVNVYVSDETKTDSLVFYFSQDPIWSVSNIKSIVVNSGLVTGWNYLKLKKSDFGTNGTGAWSGIQSMRVAWVSTTDATGEYISLQSIQLVKKSPDGDFPSPFQYNGVTEFTINSGELYVGEEFGKNVIKLLDIVSTDTFALQSTTLYKDFLINNIYCVDSNDTPYNTFVKDSSNRAYALISNNVATIVTIEGGNVTSYTGDSLILNDCDIVNCTFEKTGNNLRAKFYKNGNVLDTAMVSATTTLEEGNNAIGFATSFGNPSVYSTSITQLNHAHHSDVAEVAKGLTEQAYCKIYNNASQSIPNATQTITSLNTVIEDNREHFDSQNQDRIIVREDGLYKITGNYVMEVNATGYRTITLLLNNSTIMGIGNINAVNGDASRLNVSAEYKLKKGDYIQMRVYQNSGAALSVLTALPYSPMLSISKLN